VHLEIDRYGDRDSPLHRLDGRLRTVAVVVWAAALVWVSTPGGAGAGFLLAFGLAVTMRIPLKAILVRLAAVAVVLSPLLIIFPVLASSGTRQAEFGTALVMVARGCGLVLLTFPLFNAARFQKTMAGFRSLGAPRALTSVFLLTYRALFIFLEDKRRMELSARTRGWEGGGGRRALALCASHVGSLLVRSLDRTDRMWHAMRTRAFAGEFPVLEGFAVRRADAAVFGVLVLIPVLLVLSEYRLT
jgi:cobalt/nickel transport system permease protein